MSDPRLDEKPFHLQGNFAPVSEQVTASDLPVARVKLPQRVPDGFHGSWLPDLD